MIFCQPPFPPKYYADVFISIHADGNPDESVRGFKIAGPRRDYSGRSAALTAALTAAYREGTPLPEDPHITRRMTAYYAFNWARYQHAIHPYTPAVIIETGFLTNAADRALLINEPQQVASAISSGIRNYLSAIPPALPAPTTLTIPDFPLTGTITCAPVREERRQRDRRPCEASLRTANDDHYLLLQDPPLATSSLPYEATVTGSYVPVQMLNNYFWFHWEVAGLIQVDTITQITH